MNEPTPQTDPIDPKIWQQAVRERIEKLEKLKAQAENTLMPWTKVDSAGVDTEFVREQLFSTGNRRPRGFCPVVRICRQAPDIAETHRRIKNQDGNWDNLKISTVTKASPSKFMILIWLSRDSDTGVSNGRHYSVEELPTAIKDHQKLVDMYLKTIGGFTLLEESVE